MMAFQLSQFFGKKQKNVGNPTADTVNPPDTSISMNDVDLLGEPETWDPLGNQWRHEWKYLISVSDAVAIRTRLRVVAEPDPHVGNHGRYWIRSLYFDNAQDQALREKLDGVDSREKFRIRYYNHDPSLLHLEKKYKHSGVGSKFSETISRKTVEDILRDPMGWFLQTDAFDKEYWEMHPLLNEVYHKMLTQGLRPKCIVDYMREPYQFAAGNVRVTFDYDLRTTSDPSGFLDPYSNTISASYPLRMMGDLLRGDVHPNIWDRDGNCKDRLLPKKWERLDPEAGDFPVGRAPVLMEVKWDAILPEIIRDVIQTPCLASSAFSKYAHCRAFL